MKKHSIALWIVLGAALLALTGCAKGGQADASAKDGQEERTEQTARTEETENAEETGQSADNPAEAERRTEEEREARVEIEGDRVLSSVNAETDSGRTLRLDAIGKTRDNGHCAIREVRVYEDGRLVQTVTASEAGRDALPNDGYTDAPSVEEAMRVLDMNFDGADDLDLFAQTTVGGAVHCYWFWNNGIGRYLYALALEGAEINAAAREVLARYSEDSAYYTDHYRPASDGSLILFSREVEDWDLGTEDFPLRERYEYPDGEETLIYQEFTDYDDEGRTIREIREQVDGELIPVRLEELEVTDGSIRVIRTEDVPRPTVQAEPEEPEELEEPQESEEA